jgi:hypothetical protein
MKDGLETRRLHENETVESSQEMYITRWGSHTLYIDARAIEFSLSPPNTTHRVTSALAPFP